MEAKNGQKESILNTFYKIAFLVYVPVFLFTKLVDFIAHTGWDVIFVAKISLSLCALLFSFIGFLRYFIFRTPFGFLWLESFSTNLFKTRLIAIYLLTFGFLFYELGRQKAIQSETPKFNWKLATTWSGSLKDLNVQLAQMADEIKQASKGQFQIDIYEAGTALGKRGETIQAFDLFDALSRGYVDMIHSAAYYWEKIPAAVFFSAIPFGMDHDEMDAWVEEGQEGYALWKELYSKYGVIPFPCGHTGPQMGGWFKKEIRGLDDIKGLKIRIPALGGKVLARLGAIPSTNVEQRKILSMLDNNSLDAAEWIGPYHDHELGLDQRNMFYYEPGWQEPNTMFELVVNKVAYEKLPPSLQTLLDITTRKYNIKIYESIRRNNAIWFDKLKNNNVPFRTFPPIVIEKLRKETPGALEAYIASDRSGMAQKIYDSYKRFTHKAR